MRSNSTEALNAAGRACRRSAAVVHLELERGLNGLASIASTAGWLGLLAVVLGIPNSFPAIVGNKESILWFVIARLSRAFAPCAFGLLVALTAMWCYRYLLSKVEEFDSEMETGSLQLMNNLDHLHGTRESS